MADLTIHFKVLQALSPPAPPVFVLCICALTLQYACSPSVTQRFCDCSEEALW